MPPEEAKGNVPYRHRCPTGCQGLARLSQIRGYFPRRRAVNISWNTRAWIDETIDKLGTHCSMVTDTTARHDCCILDAGTPDWSAKRQLKDANESIARRSQEPCPA